MRRTVLNAIHLAFLANVLLLMLESFTPLGKRLFPLCESHLAQLALVVLVALSIVEGWACLRGRPQRLVPETTLPKAKPPLNQDGLPRILRMAFLFDLALLLVEEIVPASHALLPLGIDHLTQAAFVALLAAVILLIEDLH